MSSQFDQLQQRQIKSNEPISSSSLITSNLDPIAVLKRVEDLRKWQEEEKNKLMQAHEDHMLKFKLEQERLRKTHLNDSKIPVNYLVKQQDIVDTQEDDDDEDVCQLTEQELNLARKIKNQYLMKKINLEAFVDDVDDDDEFETNNFNEINNEHEINQLNREDVEDTNNRLSTILEVSCEESPLKAKQQSSNNYRRNVLENNLKNKIKPVIEDNEEELETKDDLGCVELDQNDLDPTLDRNVIDIDSIPIGVKPTNKMSFEQLLEEKLKHADELEKEQIRSSSVKKKPFLKKQTNKSTVVVKQTIVKSTQIAPPQPQPPPPPQPSSFEINDSSEPTQTSRTIGPRKYLKRGEGLKRYQPRSQSANPTVSSTSNSVSSNLTKQGSSSSINSESKPLQRQTASTSKLRSVSSSSLNPPVQVQSSSSSQLNSKKTMTKSQSVTNMNQFNNTNNKKVNNSKQVQSTSNITSKPVNKTVNSSISTTAKLKPAVQVTSTSAPVPTPLPIPQVQPPQPVKQFSLTHDDSELNEFETLEQYVDEHPSFRSTVSFVETVLTNNKKKQQQQQQDSTRTMFSKMLSLLKSNSSSNYGKQLADLLEEGLNELNVNNRETISEEDERIDDELDENEIEDVSHQRNEKLIEDENMNNNANNNRDEMNSSASTTSSSRRRTKSQSELSTMSNSSSSNSGGKSLTRKIKKLEYENDDFIQRSIDSKRYSSETDLVNHKKKYSCFDYEDDDEEDEEFKTKEDDLDLIENKINLLTSSLPQQPNTSSRYNSQESLDLKIKKTDKKNSKFDDKDSWLDVKQVQQQQQQQQKQDELLEEQSTGVSQLMTKLFPSLKQQQQHHLQQIQKEQEQKDKEAFEKFKQKTTASTEVNANATLLKQKLAQLEKEIENFQKKNLELSKLKEKCELELKSTETNRKLFEKQREEELARLKEIHDEEMRKLKLEKKVFEQYKQSLKEHPDRREREEIERLKKQVSELTEELKLKESRWTANNNRLKERIENLEQEKQELKEELQLIEKQRIESLMMISSNNTNSNVPNTNVNSPLNGQLTNVQRNATNNLLTTNVYKTNPTQSLEQTNLVEYNTSSKLSTQNSSQTTSKPTIGTNLAHHPNINVYNHTQIQPNTNLMILKRSISEKSLHSSSSTSSSSSSSSSSSTSSSCSSSSSASIASTGSLALQSNLKYYQQQQQTSLENSPTSHTHIPYPTMQQPSHLLIQSYENYSSNLPPSTLNSLQQQCVRKSISPQINSINPKQAQQQQQQKSVKFKLDYTPTPLSTVPIPYYDYEKENSSNNSHNTSSNMSNDSCSMNTPTLVANQKVNSEEFITPMIGNHNRPVRVKETRHLDDRHIEKLLEDGTTITMFTNGTTREVSADKRHTFVKFFNGDRKEMNHETGTETYFYAETNITQIVYSNGMQLLKFPSGQIEKLHANKTKEIIFPDKIRKIVFPDGREESHLPNGTCIKVDPNGTKIIEYPNKQREIHTKEYKRREYPDGNIKTVYTNGISETIYSNGRVRIKDSAGNIISDKKA